MITQLKELSLLIKKNIVKLIFKEFLNGCVNVLCFEYGRARNDNVCACLGNNTDVVKGDTAVNLNVEVGIVKHRHLLYGFDVVNGFGNEW